MPASMIIYSCRVFKRNIVNGEERLMNEMRSGLDSVSVVCSFDFLILDANLTLTFMEKPLTVQLKFWLV